jgi:diacylglycerol O-acyltransferase
MTVPVAPGDLTWLLMDRPNNLMYVHGVLWLEKTPDWDAVREVLQERLVQRFPVFGRRAVEIDGEWVWEDDPEFDLDNQVRSVTLPAPGTPKQIQDYISGRFSQPFDPAHPLWQVDLIEGIDDGRAMVLARFHHGIADGVRLVQVLLSLLDPMQDGAIPSAVGRSGRRSGPAGMAAGVAKGVVGGAADFVSGMVSSAQGAVTGIPRALTQGWIAVRNPTRITDAVSEVASEDNMLVNSWRSVSRLTLSGRSVDTVWSGTPGVEKKVAWITGLQLSTIRDIGKAHTVTINDVMLSAVSLGVTEYLTEKGEDSVDQVSWLVPVSLKPIDANIPKDLGNHFAVVMLPMPLGIRDPHTLLREMHSRMNRIKNSAEPMILYGVQRMVAETPTAVSVRLTNFVANKTVGLITNVPGPRVPMALAGTPVTGVLGWVPASGDQPLGVCIFSYNGEVNVGIAGDAGLVPDPDRLAELIEKAIGDLAAGV